MTLLIYLSVGLVIFWLAGVLASFVKKKTGNTFLSVVTLCGSAYLLLELALVLATKLRP